MDRTNTAKLQESYDPSTFQAGSYIKHLKRSVEKSDKKSHPWKEHQKTDLDLFAQSVSELVFSKPITPATQIQSRSTQRQNKG